MFLSGVGRCCAVYHLQMLRKNDGVYPQDPLSMYNFMIIVIRSRISPELFPEPTVMRQDLIYMVCWRRAKVAFVDKVAGSTLNSNDCRCAGKDNGEIELPAP
jgi:hypothetical protein